MNGHISLLTASGTASRNLYGEEAASFRLQFLPRGRPKAPLTELTRDYNMPYRLFIASALVRTYTLSLLAPLPYGAA